MIPLAIRWLATASRFRSAVVPCEPGATSPCLRSVQKQHYALQTGRESIARMPGHSLPARRLASRARSLLPRSSPASRWRRDCPAPVTRGASTGAPGAWLTCFMQGARKIKCRVLTGGPRRRPRAPARAQKSGKFRALLCPGADWESIAASVKRGE